MASQTIINQLTLLPKDNKQAVGVKQLYTLFEAMTIIDPALAQEAGRQGQQADHHRCLQSQSPRRDSTNSLSSSGRWCGQSRDERDLRDIFQTKDMCDRIEIHRQDLDWVEKERHNERHYDMYNPYYD
jgi:hypothetical protein